MDSANLGQVAQVGCTIGNIIGILEINSAQLQKQAKPCIIFSKVDRGGEQVDVIIHNTRNNEYLETIIYNNKTQNKGISPFLCIEASRVIYFL